MDVGIFAPVIGVVLAVVIVLVLWRVMRARATKSAARVSASSLTESEAEFLDSSHIINGPISRPAADARRNATDKSAPPLNRLP